MDGDKVTVGVTKTVRCVNTGLAATSVLLSAILLVTAGIILYGWARHVINGVEMLCGTTLCLPVGVLFLAVGVLLIRDTKTCLSIDLNGITMTVSRGFRLKLRTVLVPWGQVGEVRIGERRRAPRLLLVVSKTGSILLHIVKFDTTRVFMRLLLQHASDRHIKVVREIEETITDQSGRIRWNIRKTGAVGWETVSVDDILERLN